MTDIPDAGEQPGDVIGELDRERLADGQRILASYVERSLLPSGYLNDDWATVQAWIGQLSDEERRCLLFASVAGLTAGAAWASMEWLCYLILREWPLRLDAGDVRLLVSLAEPGGGHCAPAPFKLIVELTRQLVQERAPGAAALADALADKTLAWNPLYRGVHVLAPCMDSPVGDLGLPDILAEFRDAALELAMHPPAPPEFEGPVHRDDGFGLAVIGLLGPVEDWPPGLAAFLAHCASARSSKPSRRWERRCAQYLAALPDAAGMVAVLLRLVVTTPPQAYLTGHGRVRLLAVANVSLILGLVWAAALLNEDWLPEVLHSVAERWLRLARGRNSTRVRVPVFGDKVPFACFDALARSGSQVSLVALARLGRATSHKMALARLRSVLEQSALERGQSVEVLLDHLVPDHGLDESGTTDVSAGGLVGAIVLHDQQGAVLAGPDAVALAGRGEVAGLLAEVRASVSAVRERLESLFAQPREWHIDDFLDCYVRHPLTGPLARRLVWVFTPLASGADPVHGFPEPGGLRARTTAGVRPVPPGSLVRLLHPVLADEAELQALREVALAEGIRQPVRQLWRETYRPGQDERDGLRSARYAGHILRSRQLFGLARRRGWAGGYLSGVFDGGGQAVARRDFPAAGVRVSWPVTRLYELSDEAGTGLCLTGEAVFSPAGDLDRTPIPVTDLPPEVFSEAMRDLDLFVSVTTVANDWAWLSGYSAQPVLAQYWERARHGGFDQLRASRRLALAPLYASPEPGDRFELTERDLVVRGSLATYRIDLATANVLMEPAGKWLAFDTKAPAGQDLLDRFGWLPAIDDDEILHRIMIRAGILAHDERLASRKLLRQIRQ